ncbi:MAG: site-specific integrase [Candidatus Omnitrophota bacterium]
MSSLYRRKETYWLSFRESGKHYCISLKTKDKTTALFLKTQKDLELLQGRSILPNQNNLCRPVLEEYKSFMSSRRTPEHNQTEYHAVKYFLDWGNINTFAQINKVNLQGYLDYRFKGKIDKKGKIKVINKNTANHIIASIKFFLRYAASRHVASDNPILKEIKNYRLEEQDIRFFSKKEIVEILKTARNRSLYADGNPTLYPVIATGIYSGLRQEELFNLRWENIDFTRRVISVANKGDFKTKSRRNRVIPLHPCLKLILQPLRKQKGLCFDTTNERKIFNRILLKAKLKEPRVRWHTLRHTFATQALMAGVPLFTVSRWLGHSDIKTTMKYAHFCPDHSQREINKLDF